MKASAPATLALALLLLNNASGFTPSPSRTIGSRHVPNEQLPGSRRRGSMGALHIASRPTLDDEASNTKRQGKKSQKPKTGPLFVSTAADPASEETDEPGSPPSSFLDRALSGYLGPRIVLAIVAIVYGTNFPLGSMMADALPASAVTSGRMLIATLALSPFLFQIKPSLRLPAIMCGCFTATGYISQSLALVDTSPATVSFLGSATVLMCPFLEWLLDGKKMSIKDAPQTWLAAGLCLAGVGVLELCDPSGGGLSSSFGAGDALALVQAVGFGTGVFLSERMVSENPSQALPITATLVATTALLSSIWCLTDGWMFTQPGWETFTLPNLFFEPSLQLVGAAILWTGLVSTALNFFVEISALGRVAPAEASVILASEPMWAALFAAVIMKEQLGMNDYVGGLLMILACLANSLSPSDFEKILGSDGASES